MPTRLLFEGPDIDALLVRIHEEHGPGARIVQADRVRSGGIGGFFSREHFAVAVEVDAPGAPGAPAPGPAPAAQQGQVTVEDRQGETVRDAFGDRMGERVEQPLPERLPLSLLELAEAVGAAEAATSRPTVVHLPADLSPDRAPVETTPLFSAVSAEDDSFARVLDGLSGAGPEPVARSFVAATPPAAPRASSGPLARAYGLGAEPPADGPSAEPSGPAEPGRPGEPSRPTERFEEPAEPAPAAPAAPVAPAAQPAPARPAGAKSTPRPGGLLGRLLARGVPREVAEAVEVGGPDGLAGALARALADLPAPPSPPRGPGALLVVLGDGPRAYEAARDVARRARQDPGEVWLAAPSALGAAVPGERLVRDVPSVRRLAHRLRGGDVPAVVAVDAALGADDWAMEEVAETLGALGADAVWVLVDATVKPGDVEHHLDRLGRVDALVVHGAAATLDPGTCLGIALGRQLPTALVDGRRGDAATWARLVADGAE